MVFTTELMPANILPIDSTFKVFICISTDVGNERIELIPSNIELISVTFEVLKFDETVKLLSELIPENMLIIFSTFEVSILDGSSRRISDDISANIYDMSSTFEVSKSSGIVRRPRELTPSNIPLVVTAFVIFRPLFGSVRDVSPLMPANIYELSFGTQMFSVVLWIYILSSVLQ